MGDGFALFDIIIFAMLAGYLVFQLRRVLGRRTEQERQREETVVRRTLGAAENDNVVQIPERELKESPADGDAGPAEPVVTPLERLKAADPDFDEREFLRGARAAFEWIVAAFAKGDRATLENLLGPGLLAQFEAVIDQRNRAGEVIESTVSAVRSATIDDVSMSGAIAEVTVEFTSDQVKAHYTADGDLIDGDPDRIESLTDIWVFQRDTRSAEPNWVLVATREPED